MDLKLAYGTTGLAITLRDDLHVTVLEPGFTPPLPDPDGALRVALVNPMEAAPLAVLVQPDDTVAVVFSDITRPAPNARMLPAILEALAHVPDARIVLCNALGTHRPNTPDELARMLGPDLVRRFRIEQNNAFDPATQVHLGQTAWGHELWINAAYMAADVKILTGFIEPHFFAGYSGGGKAVMPGMAGLTTILGNHDAGMIDDPQATWGVTRGNPIWEEIRAAALATRPDFLLNVTLNRDQAITGVFAGALDTAHAAGTSFVARTALVPVDAPFDIVITTNSGYPLDQNLYQSVKGMRAASQIVKPGGAIVIATACADGLPDHGLYGELLRAAETPAELLEAVRGFEAPQQDQWEAQVQALVQLQADVYVYTDGLSDAQVREALLTPCHDIPALVDDLVARYGPDARIAVLPEGPQTIAYVREGDATPV